MKWIKQAAALCVLAAPAAAFAGSATGYIKSMYIPSNDYVYIELSGVKANNPACSTSTTAQFVVLGPNYENWGYYHEILEMLQTAEAGGLTITITGAGKCALDPTAEDLSALQL